MRKNTLPIPNLTESDLERFWSKVAITANPNSCWNWTSSKLSWGYGGFYLKGKTVRSHRVAYFIYNGSVPDNLLILHRCDNPLCCNYLHLFAGTDLDNNRDMEAKKRGNHVTGERSGAFTHPEKLKRGTENNLSKLTEEDVIKIAEMRYSNKMSLSAIAKLYNISISGVWAICQGKVWKHLMSEHKKDISIEISTESQRKKSSIGEISRGIGNNNAKICDADVPKILQLYYTDKWTYKKIADLYGVTICPIERICTGKGWRHVLISDELKREITNQHFIHGSHNYKAKLTENDVVEILKIRKDIGMSFADLARRYSVDDSLIARICRRQAWKHVDIE